METAELERIQREGNSSGKNAILWLKSDVFDFIWSRCDYDLQQSYIVMTSLGDKVIFGHSSEYQDLMNREKYWDLSVVKKSSVSILSVKAL